MDDGQTTPPGDAGQSAPRVGLILGAVAVTLLFASLGQTIVTTALPTMVADLGGLDHITWVVTAYLLASTIGAPLSGKLGDLYGRKRVMQTQILIFMAGSVIAGLAGSMGVLVAARAIQGFGAGGLIVVSMAVVADVLPPRERGRAQALLGAAFGVSTVVGPLVGGFLVEAASWHWIFFVNLPIGVVAFVVLGIVLERTATEGEKRIDALGAALLATILATLVMISNLGGSVFPWASAQILGLIALALGATMAFVAVERRAAEPILPMSLFRSNAFLVMNGVGLMVGCAMFGTITFVPLFLQIAKGVSPATSGLFLVPMMGGLILSSALAGRTMDRTGRYKWLPIASTAVLAGALASLSTLSGDTPLWAVATALVGVGIGLGPVFSVGVAAIQNAVPVSMLGVGTASANMFRLIGGAIGTAAFGGLFSAGLAQNLAGQMPEGSGTGMGSVSAAAVARMPAEVQTRVIAGVSDALHPIFWAAAAIAVIACLVATRLHEQPIASTVPAE